MNTDQVMVLIDLAQTHSFNQTAERLYTTQQNISYKMKQLERELQTKIFLRSNNGVEFTADGEYVLQCAHEMERSYRLLKEKIVFGSKQDEHSVNVVRLYISSVLLSSKMTQVIKVFNKKFPEVKLVIKEIAPDKVIHSLFSYKCDIAFCSINEGFYAPFHKECQKRGITSYLVQKDSALAVVSEMSGLADKEKLSLYDLTHQPKSIFGMLPLDYFGKNTEPFILYENSNLGIHKQLIREEGVICFTSQITYDHLFLEDDFLAKPFDYPTLPIEHIIMSREIMKSEEMLYLEQLLIQSFNESE